MMRLIFAAVLVTLSMNVDLSSTSSIITPLNGWIKYACTAENIKRSKTYFCDTTGKIHCLPGWTDESQLCQVPVCEINGQDCVRGNCSKPFTCDCEVGWTGPFCDKCVCLPGCVNGHCNQSFECICETGWQGMLCDKPVCEGCIHGDCVMPGMCICHPGWSGPDCSICENRLDCQNGRCIDEPYQCECYDGYFGPSCEFPVCREGCHPDNGWCMMPDTCWCREGWTGPNCTECVPYWNCNHGHCVKPWECICDEGYFGRECNETQNIDGQWGQWSDETPCSVTCGNGTKTRKRHCDNPPKSGNGSYCSLDGSSSTEVIPCNLGPCVEDCPGCWHNITRDWQKDALLIAVVHEAQRGTSEYLSEVFPLVIVTQPSLDVVSSFQSQVVAGVNFRMTLRLTSDEESFTCTGARVFQPLPVYCHEPNFCLHFDKQELQCSQA